MRATGTLISCHWACRATTATYHSWRSARDTSKERSAGVSLASSTKPKKASETLALQYEDQPGYCKSASLKEIAKHDYVLTPGRYVGAAPLEDDGIPFETKMTEMSQTLYKQMEESTKLDEVIRRNLRGLGYGE